jgi:hypothetical protein
VLHPVLQKFAGGGRLQAAAAVAGSPLTAVSEPHNHRTQQTKEQQCLSAEEGPRPPEGCARSVVRQGGLRVCAHLAAVRPMGLTVLAGPVAPCEKREPAYCLSRYCANAAATAFARLK